LTGSVVCASLRPVANWYEPIGGNIMMAPSGHSGERDHGRRIAMGVTQ
jgi:hypothetical protein